MNTPIIVGLIILFTVTAACIVKARHKSTPDYSGYIPASIILAFLSFVGLLITTTAPLGDSTTTVYRLNPSHLELTPYRLIVTIAGIERQYQDAKTVLAATKALPTGAIVTRYSNAWGYQSPTTAPCLSSSPDLTLIFPAPVEQAK
jgi:hypothetical protein